MQDEVYALYVYATTTTIGTNTQIYTFLIADSCVSAPVDCKSGIKNISHTVFKPLFGRVEFPPPIYIYRWIDGRMDR